MEAFRIESIGWFVAGIISGTTGLTVYGSSPTQGFFDIVIGVVAIFISFAIVRVIELYRRVILKKKPAGRRR